MVVKMSFGKVLREIRTESNYSAEYLSNLLNCSKSLIYEWEKDRSQPSIEALIKLSTIFDVTIDFLLGKEGDFILTKQEVTHKSSPLSKKIKDLRNECGITQQMLSEELGVEKYIVSNWEQARSTPSTEDLIKIADVFDISVDELLGRNDFIKANQTNIISHKHTFTLDEQRLLKAFNKLDERSKMRLIEDAEYFAKKVTI